MDVPDHAAVSLGVTTTAGHIKTRSWKNLVNGVLRNLARRRAAILADQDAERLNTPDWLWRRWTESYGAETARAIAAMHLVEPALDLTVRADPKAWAERLGADLLPGGSLRLVAPGAVEHIDGFSEGAWWVQDLAASIPARLFGDVAGKRVADLCAAPGGKTVQLAAAGADVTAVDISSAAVQLDWNDPAPSRHSPDQARHRYREPCRTAGKAAAPGSGVGPSRGPSRLFDLFAGAGGGRGPDRPAVGGGRPFRAGCRRRQRGLGA